MSLTSRVSTNGRCSAENNWLTYSRLLGSVTVLCVGLALVLDQLYCEMRDMATHWPPAVLLAIVAAFCLLTLLPATVVSCRVAALLNGGCIIMLILVAATLELCKEQLTLGVILLVTTACASLITMSRLFSQDKH